MRRGRRYYYYRALFPDMYQVRRVRQSVTRALRRGLAGLDQFFWSGLSDVSELTAAFHAGRGVGVGLTVLSGPEGRPLGEARIAALRGLPTDKDIFLDSGAYSAELAGVNLDTHRIRGERAWDFIFDTYARIIDSRPKESVFVVAPDVVGSQPKTLRRLTRHAEEIKKLYKKGARVLVALQPGRLPPEELAREVDRVLNIPWVPAFPARALRSLTSEELRRFVRARKPALIHLLGVGPAVDFKTLSHKILPPLRREAAQLGIPLHIQSDSAFTRAITREIREHREGVRKRVLLEEIKPFWVGSDSWQVPGGPTFDWTEDWALAFDDVPAGMLEEIAKTIWIDPDEPGPRELTQKEIRQFVADPSGFLEYPPRALGISADPGFENLSRHLLTKTIFNAYVDYLASLELAGDIKRVLDIRSSALAQLARAPEPEVGTIGLISCGGKKVSGYAKARDLYTGPIFTDMRRHMEKRELPYFILSAKHGLLHPSQRIRSYDQELSSKKSDRLAWAQKIVAQLRKRLGALRGISFELHAGRKYRDPLADLLRKEGAFVRHPVAGKDVYQLRSYYRRFVA